jgi:hypothetical protein
MFVIFAVVLECNVFFASLSIAAHIELSCVQKIATVHVESLTIPRPRIFPILLTLYWFPRKLLLGYCPPLLYPLHPLIASKRCNLVLTQCWLSLNAFAILPIKATINLRQAVKAIRDRIGMWSNMLDCILVRHHQFGT